MPGGVGAVDLEGGKPLHGLEEHAAGVDVAAPVLRTNLLGIAHDGHDGGRDERHAHHEHGRGEARLPHEQGKQRHRGKQRIEELRQVAAKADLQLACALDAGLHGLGCGDGLGVAGAELRELAVHEPAHAAHGEKRRPVALALGQVDGDDADEQGDGERRGGLAHGRWCGCGRCRRDGRRDRRGKHAGRLGHPGRNRLEPDAHDARERPHHRDVGHQGEPLAHEARHDVRHGLGHGLKTIQRLMRSSSCDIVGVCAMLKLSTCRYMSHYTRTSGGM